MYLHHNLADINFSLEIACLWHGGSCVLVTAIIKAIMSCVMYATVKFFDGNFAALLHMQGNAAQDG